MTDKEERGAELKNRTKKYALRIIRMYVGLPKTTEAQVMGKQVLRSGTSAGAQYREAMRARSRAEFISKIESCLQELNESEYWLELLVDSDVMPAARMTELLDETRELMAMLTASAKTAKENKEKNG